MGWRLGPCEDPFLKVGFKFSGDTTRNDFITVRLAPLRNLFIEQILFERSSIADTQPIVLFLLGNDLLVGLVGNRRWCIG